MSNQPTIAESVQRSLKKRYQAERRFRLFGIASIAFGLLSVAVLFGDIIYKGHGAFTSTYIRLTVNYDSDVLGITDVGDERQMALADYDGVIKKSLQEQFPDVAGRRDKKLLFQLASTGAGYQLQDHLKNDPALLDRQETIWVLADDEVDTYFKSMQSENPPIGRLAGSELAQGWVAELEKNGQIKTRFNRNFFTKGDSREPELAGIWGAAKGSFYTLLLTFLLSFPIGVATAIYLEEFAPKNKWTDLIEVNINNLAAVPSIIFGLLGLAIFANFFGVPRSVPVIGGLVLTLMTLPTIIISGRAAIKSVPPSIREAALGIGASPMQVVLHHVLPLALPGMLTGAIIGMAQALGETAPLLMIGMVAFIVDIPQGFTDPSTVLPVQIFLWSDSPERAFTEKTSAAIMVLLGFLLVMNAAAVILRKRLERRW